MSWSAFPQHAWEESPEVPGSHSRSLLQESGLSEGWVGAQGSVLPPHPCPGSTPVSAPLPRVLRRWARCSCSARPSVASPVPGFSLAGVNFFSRCSKVWITFLSATSSVCSDASLPFSYWSLRSSSSSLCCSLSVSFRNGPLLSSWAGSHDITCLGYVLRS